MALYVKQDNNQTELQRRIADELQEKAKKRTLDIERPDGVDDSKYLESMKQTTSLAWVWALIGIAAIAIIIWLVIETTRVRI